MNLVELHHKVIAVARANPPSDHVPLSFEKRIMALILAGPIVDKWDQWSRALWCAAAPCVAVMLLLTGWAFFNQNGESSSSDLSHQFDTTMLVAMDQDTDVTW